jgi:hypothetical protein
MALIRFNFNRELPKDKQDAILAQMNSQDAWLGIDGAGRIYEDSDDPEVYSQCYFRFTESSSSKGRRSEVLAQYLFTLNEIRTHQYEKAWVVEPEPETGETEVHPRIWTA